MPKEDWKENTVEKLFQREGLYPTGKISTVLDVGCGLSLKSQYINADIRLGLDIYPPFLEKIECPVPYAVLKADALDISKLFLPDSFDLVLLLDIVEHLYREEASHLIRMAEDIAKVAVIIETPQGYVPQNIDIWGCGGHEYQTHRSWWTKEELEEKGYTVLLRDYTMSDVRRHTKLDVNTDIVIMDAIKRFDGEGT